MNVRNLEQIQEEDTKRSRSRLGTLFLASIGGAALVFVGLSAFRRAAPPVRSNPDPLAALVARAKSSAEAPGKLDGREISFPRLLSDGASSTTALAAVKDERGRLLQQEATPPLPSSALPAPPLASDRLPIAPLPVGQLLGASSVVTDPKDDLSAMAATVSRVDDGAVLAPVGTEGGYQIQVASFKDLPDADRLVEDLRKRGHRAFRQAAYVPGRGLWHRVRIGPFKTLFEAKKYKREFERTERVSPFVVDPDKVKQAEETRQARVEARDKRAAASRKPLSEE